MNETTRYEITIENDADADARETLADLAADANATFTNIDVIDAHEPRFASTDVTLVFDATPDDAARYATFYDCDPLDPA